MELVHRTRPRDEQRLSLADDHSLLVRWRLVGSSPTFDRSQRIDGCRFVFRPLTLKDTDSFGRCFHILIHENYGYYKLKYTRFKLKVQSKMKRRLLPYKNTELRNPIGSMLQQGTKR